MTHHMTPEESETFQKKLERHHEMKVVRRMYKVAKWIAFVLILSPIIYISAAIGIGYLIGAEAGYGIIAFFLTAVASTISVVTGIQVFWDLSEKYARCLLDTYEEEFKEFDRDLHFFLRLKYRII